MVSKSEGLEKRTLNLRRGDAEFLARHLRQHGGRANYTVFIRQLVSAAVDRIKNAQGQEYLDKRLEEAAEKIDLNQVLISGEEE